MMAIIGILVAAAIIGAVNYAKLPPGNTTSTIISRVTSYSTTTSTSISTATKISNSTAPEGTLAVQIADPLSLPSGTTHVYLQYGDIEVHTMLGNASIWFRIAPGNTIDLTTLSDNAVTVGITGIPAEQYDSVRLSITSALVTFEGKNITATLPQTEVSIPIGKSGIDLAPNTTSGILFDISPTIVPTASENGTQMELIPYAEALSIPSSVPESDYASIGSTLPLDSQSWFTSTQTDLSGNVTVLAALVANNAMLVVLKNTGNSSVTINGLTLLAPGAIGSSLVTVVTTITTVTTITEYAPNGSAKLSARDSQNAYRNFGPLSGERSSALPLSAYQTVATFFVLSNGEVIQPTIGSNPQQLGLVLAPGQNASLTFSSKIQTLDSLSAPYAPLQILSGSQYMLEVEGPFGQSEVISISAISPF